MTTKELRGEIECEDSRLMDEEISMVSEKREIRIEEFWASSILLVGWSLR